MQLLDFYRHRFGNAVKQQGAGWNGPCPLCGGEPGKSDRFMVWPDRDENLGETCTRYGVKGVWSCRQCGAHGDSIAFLMKAEGMTFKTACAELGISDTGSGSSGAGHRRRPAPVEPRRELWTPKTWECPTAKWSAYAGKLVEEAAERIFSEPDALRWLALRGLDEAAVRRYRIGYLPGEGGKPGRYRHRSALGLEPKTGDDGRVRDKIFIPRGIVVPTLDMTGAVINLRIRRHKEDLSEHSPKYLELEGSGKGPLVLVSDSPRPVATYFITEAELDAMLIHHVSGGIVGALAVRTNRGKPDAAAHPRLMDAARVCVALDYDAPGAEGVEFWTNTYSTARRWPTPEGKDPGDAFRLGVDMRAWIAAGLPACTALPDKISLESSAHPHRASIAHTGATTQDDSESGHLDMCAAGLGSLGGRGNPEHDLGAAPSVMRESGEEGMPPAVAPEQMPTSDKYEQEQQRSAPPSVASPGLFTDAELRSLQAALPDYLRLMDLPADVARAWLLWRGLSVRFERYGNGYFGWEYGLEWKNGSAVNRERFEAFRNFQDGSTVLWDWFSAHEAQTITANNLLNIWG